MPADATETLAAPPAVIDESNLLRSVIRLAWPVVVQQVSFSMVQLVDTALVGHLGEDALAGVRLAGQIFWFSQAGMVAVGVGSTAIVARHVGAGEPEQGLARRCRTPFADGAGLGHADGRRDVVPRASWGLGMLGAEPGAQHEGDGVPEGGGGGHAVLVADVRRQRLAAGRGRHPHADGHRARHQHRQHHRRLPADQRPGSCAEAWCAGLRRRVHERRDHRVRRWCCWCWRPARGSSTGRRGRRSSSIRWRRGGC